jgi:FdhD protein
VTLTIEPHVALAWIERVGPEGRRGHEHDEVAVEEPLRIRVDGEPIAVAMRTPGEDEELAAGFLAGRR